MLRDAKGSAGLSIRLCFASVLINYGYDWSQQFLICFIALGNEITRLNAARFKKLPSSTLTLTFDVKCEQCT